MVVSQPPYPVADKLFWRDPRFGGITAIVFGEMGAGKTTFLTNIALAMFKHDYIIWRGMFSAQALYYWPKEFQLLVPDGFKLKVWNIDKRTPVNLEAYHFSNYEQMLDALEINRLNVVFMPIDMWKEFVSTLHKLWDRNAWLTLIFDEVEELCPPYAQGEDWRINERIAEAVKEYRKCWISFYCATQQPSDVDYRLRNKMMLRVYLKGAKKMSIERFRQELIDNLEPGWAVVAGSFFEKFQYNELRPARYRMRIRLVKEGVLPSIIHSF